MADALREVELAPVQKVLDQAKNGAVGFSSLVEQNAGIGVPFTAVGAWISGGYRAVAYWEGEITELTLPEIVPAEVRKGQDWFGLSLRDGREPYLVDSGRFDGDTDDESEIGLVYLSEMDPISELARLFSELRFESLVAKDKFMAFSFSVPEGMALEYHSSPLTSCEVLFDPSSGTPYRVEWSSSEKVVKRVEFLGFQLDLQLAPSSFDFQKWDYSRKRIVVKVKAALEEASAP